MASKKAQPVANFREVNGFTIVIKGHTSVRSPLAHAELSKALAVLGGLAPSISIKRTSIDIEKGNLLKSEEVL